jgi:murein L,D-transpeptidase YafK
MRAPHALIVLFACLALTGPVVADTAGSVTYQLDWTPAERIVIEKARRKLTLIRVDNVVREFDISLGGNPLGPKQRSGDSRTPEGNYVIDAKNLYSNYYLAVHLSYPNLEDAARARKLGVDPGGNIMIHGMPNGTPWPYEGYAGRDWTDGCIAVSNAAMQEIWLATRENTPVEILP